MRGKIGDRLEMPGRHVGDPARTGQIVDVLDSGCFRVRWQDEHESIVAPTSGVTIQPSR